MAEKIIRKSTRSGASLNRSNKINPFSITAEHSTPKASNSTSPKSLLFSGHKFDQKFAEGMEAGFLGDLDLSKQPELNVEEEEAVVVQAPRLSTSTQTALANLKPVTPRMGSYTRVAEQSVRETSHAIPGNIGELSDRDDVTELPSIPNITLQNGKEEWVPMEIKPSQRNSKNKKEKEGTVNGSNANLVNNGFTQKSNGYIGSSDASGESNDNGPRGNDTTSRTDATESNGSVEPKEEEVTFPNEEILPLMDSLLQNGYATDIFRIRKTPIVFRTRFGWEEKAVLKHVQESELNSNIGYQRELNIALLAASLVQFGDDVFDPLNDGDAEELADSFKERYDFINSLNNVFVDIMQNKLSQFDKKQRYLIDHFDELMEAF